MCVEILMYRAKGQASVNWDDQPPATTDSMETSHQPPQWQINFKSLGMVIASIIFAIGVVVGALSRLSPDTRQSALSTFRSWPLLLQALVIVLALAAFIAIALWYPIRQATRYSQQQEVIAAGTKQALIETATDDVPRMRAVVEDDVPTMRKLLAEILKLLASVIVVPAPSTSTTGTIMASIPGPPAVPATAQEATKPKDDVQLTPPEIFIGRDVELRWLEERLVSHHHDRDTTVIIGISGIGKTALASIAIDHIKAHHFAGGIARVKCAGMNAVEIVRYSLERVDPDRRLPAALDLDILRQISEELFANKDILIVLDGVDPDVPLGEVVSALRTEQRSAHILITTTSAPSVDVVPADGHLYMHALGTVTRDDGSEVDEALELFARYAGMQSAAEFGKNISAAGEIVESLGRHTYALQLVGAYLQVEPDIAPVLAEEIKRHNDGTVPYEIEGILRRVWVANMTTVNALPPDARSLLFAFGAFGSPEAGRNATRALGKAIGIEDVDRVIHILARRQLMESFHTPTMPDSSDCYRLRIHTLLHAYIAREITVPERADQYVRARDAVADFYADYIRQYDRGDPTRGTQRALSPDADNITNALEWAIVRNDHAKVTALVHGMRRFWHDRWLNDKSLRYMPIAVSSAVLLANKARADKNTTAEKLHLERAADLAFTLGRVYRRTGNLAQAEPLFQRDLQFRRKHKPPLYAAQAEALHQLAQLERSRGRMRKALHYCRQGLRVIDRHYPRGRDVPSHTVNAFNQAKGLLLAQKGRIERSRGNLRTADRLFERAFPLFAQTGDLLEQGVSLGYRGRIARVLGQLERAQMFFARSGEFAHQAYDFRGEGIISTQQGRIDRAHGDLGSAERRFKDGLNKARQVLDTQAVAVNLNYLGRIAASRGNVLEAEDYFKRALEQAREINDRLDQGVNLGYLGRIARERGFLPEARRNFHDSLKILREVEDRRGEGLILAQVALLDVKSRHLTRARWRFRRSLRLIRTVGDMRSEGTVMMYQGQLHIARRDAAAARACLTRALKRAQLVQDRDGEAEVQLWLGRVAAMCGETEAARQCYAACRDIVANGGNKRLLREVETSVHALPPEVSPSQANETSSEN